MRTIKSLKEELNKFPDDAVCYAYEGEITGIVIVPKFNEEPIGSIVCDCDYELNIESATLYK